MAASKKARRLCSRVVKTPARTVAGLIEKLRVASTLYETPAAVGATKVRTLLNSRRPSLCS
jgi:hypothetical protein